ncbi:hypothetical protein [Mesorhizobium sp. ES1-1]|uniref:hypothetical protein n=1 Tax=Mesorhizobium sp. ES1-1 TaxID=2876629 RepID=UPI001CCAE8A8|nr:hypothetical protein [Mesorhizobium sp. ES1-1]MBZ9678722.1 hypothetical protein [Mesorhizobium sp. ES1-1]
MTRDEFERHRRRFGDAVESWPAPFRQQALALMAAGAGPDDDDAALDRLVLEATLIEGDDQALARTVLARIDGASARSSFLPRFLLAPAGLAACSAALLVAATLAGYQAAGLQDDLQDSELLALASGARLTGNGGADIAADPAEEGSL